MCTGLVKARNNASGNGLPSNAANKPETQVRYRCPNTQMLRKGQNINLGFLLLSQCRYRQVIKEHPKVCPRVQMLRAARPA
jgi:hypothetical protein